MTPNFPGPSTTTPPPGPGRRRRQRPVAIAVVSIALVLSLAALAITSVRLARPDDEPAARAPGVSPSDAPRPARPARTGDVVGPPPGVVAERFLAAVLRVDCAGLARLSTPRYLAQGSCGDDVPSDALRGARHEQQPAAVAGASATVMAVITTPGRSKRPGTTFRCTLTLVNTGAGWRINDLAAL
ncbi:hypothetical protein [Nocardioides rubriscoriae]|uniref:hypothetical protein n=1 Tax=Nocardioides rubriscoriae TaxID=642762 RepID=UPI0011DF441D|nr:hypothetical protein [Nocardioides rubriscoriae]